jgi:hypothetical protein
MHRPEAFENELPATAGVDALESSDGPAAGSAATAAAAVAAPASSVGSAKAVVTAGSSRGQVMDCDAFLRGNTNRRRQVVVPDDDDDDDDDDDEADEPDA